VNKADDEAWYYLGLAFFHQPKKIKDAGKAFETAVKLRPAFAAAHVGLAYTHLWRNKSSEAVQVSRTALNLDPSLAEPHHIIGVVHLNAGDPDEALTEAKEAIRLNSELPAGYRLKSQALVSVYAKRTLASSLASKTSSSPQTPKHRAERHKRRLESTAVFKEAAESLAIYLRLDPSSSSADYLREQLVSLTFYVRYTGDKTNVDDAPYSADEVRTKARVLAKPEPAYTESAREALVTGTVVLQAVFSADGKVRHILVLAGLPNGLTETAVRAARQIKFTPATIDLRPVSTFVRLEYNFNLY